MTRTPPPRQPGEPSDPDAQGSPSAQANQPQPLDSSTLLQGGRSVEIRHNGELYRLQATRLGKLILTK